MALHTNFPRSPYAILPPNLRWFPAAEELRSTAYQKLLPPLVANIREGVTAWRVTDYAGASATSRALLNWWFKTDHLSEQADGTLSQFRYYFAQREAVETVIWLHDVRGARQARPDAVRRLGRGLGQHVRPRGIGGGNSRRNRARPANYLSVFICVHPWFISLWPSTVARKIFGRQS